MQTNRRSASRGYVRGALAICGGPTEGSARRRIACRVRPRVHARLHRRELAIAACGCAPQCLSSSKLPHQRSSLKDHEVEVSRHLLPAERFTKRLVYTAKTAERLNIAEQVHDTRMLLA